MALKDFFKRFKKTKQSSENNEELKKELLDVLTSYRQSLESLRDDLYQIKEDCLELLKQRGLPLDES